MFHDRRVQYQTSMALSPTAWRSVVYNGSYGIFLGVTKNEVFVSRFTWSRPCTD